MRRVASKAGTVEGEMHMFVGNHACACVLLMYAVLQGDGSDFCCAEACALFYKLVGMMLCTGDLNKGYVLERGVNTVVGDQ